MDALTSESFFRAIIDALPSPLFVVDSDVRIIAYNESALPLFGHAGTQVLLTRAGEALHCIHSTETPEGCGHSETCKLCVVRSSVGESFRGSRVTRRFQRMQLLSKDAATDVYLLVTTAPLRYNGETYATLLLEDIGDLVEARGLLPVCMYCHRVREGADYWSNVETYLKKHMDMDFSHGLCPDCLQKHYPDEAKEMLG